MKKILFIAPFESVHITRWFNFFNNTKDIDAHILIFSKLYKKETIFEIFFSLLTLKIKFLKILKNFNPDIVNIHTLLFPNYLVTKYINCKIVITPWNGDIIWHKYGNELLIIRHIKKVVKFIKSKIIKKNLNNADLITFNSNEMKRVVTSYLFKKIPIARVEVPGIETEQYDKVSQTDKIKIRKELKLPLDAFIIFSPRSLGKFYNVDIIVDAFNKVLKFDSNFILLLVYHSLKGYERINRLVTHYRIENNVIFGGEVDHSTVIKYLQSSDLCISLSSKDSSPQSVIESLSCQTPVIAGDISVIHEMIEDGKNGFIVPCKNEQLLADKIIYIKENKDMVQKIVQNGRKVVKDRYDYRNNMNKMHKLFNDLYS